MNTPDQSRLRVALVIFAAVLVLPSAYSAQALTPPALPSAPPAADEPVTLSPFEVTAGTDIGYESATAMSGTRTNESLANLPNSISVINSEFMADLGITDFFQAVEFAVGADNIYNDKLYHGSLYTDTCETGIPSS